MADQSTAPSGVDIARPNVARMYDYWLGGKDNFAADREAVEKVDAIAPDAGHQARSNREFLGRAVRLLAEAGIRQFIDIGTGLPTQGNVHEVAQEVAPGSRVVYVDHDPVVLAHGRALLATTEQVEVVQADIREPEKILRHPDTRALIDFDEPFALMLVAILHFVTDDHDPARILRTFHDAMPPGSYVAISQGTADNRPESEEGAMDVYKSATAPIVPRSHVEVSRFFEGFDLLAPGLVDVRVWGTEVRERPRDTIIYAGVGRKP